MNFFRNFLTIVVAALGSSVVGGVFGAVVAWVSPPLVRSLASSPVSDSVVRYGAGLGMIWGVLLGAAVMGFSLLISTLVRLTRALEANHTKDDKSH